MKDEPFPKDLAEGRTGQLAFLEPVNHRLLMAKTDTTHPFRVLGSYAMWGSMLGNFRKH